jgi:proliferating cell nuclear antigen
MDTEDNGDDLDIGIATCAHCGENVLDEIDLEESMTDDMDIFIPEKIVIPMGTFKTTMSGNMFKAIVGNLQYLAEEHKLSISPDKIHVQSVDPSHIAMMAMDIPRSATIEYNASTFDLGIDVGKLSDLAKMCKKDTLVDLEIVENRIAYKIGIVSGDMIPVDTAGMSDPRIPNVDLPCHFDVSIKDMLDIMKRASDITDHISITADKDKVIISANGETDNTQMVLTNGKEIQFLEIKDLLTVKSLFALDYLSNIFKALKPCAKTATIFMGTDYPIRIQTNLFAGEGEITYLLAPRIEND